MSALRAARHYTRYAALYDRIATDAPLADGLRRRIVDALAPSRGDVVVEMGCGTGANVPLLRERVGPEGAVVGVDVSAGVVARARDRIADAGWENVHVARADATAPPVAFADRARAVSPAGEVDAVLATFVTGMFDDPATVVDDWCRILAPMAGGTEFGESEAATGGKSEAATGGKSEAATGGKSEAATGEGDGAAVGGGGRICVAGFARSTHPVGRLLNPVFGGVVRLATPPSRGRGRPESPVELLDERAAAAHRRVHDRCRNATTDRALAGFARITAGTVSSGAVSSSPRNR
ncbi:hypothetical protein JCM18237_01290 [Halorubrum luteum]